jgi:excisionase family DNA binding protein
MLKFLPMAKSYTTKEAAAMLRVTPGRIRQMVVDGDLKAEKFGRDLMIGAEQIEAARKRKTAPGPSPRSSAATKGAKKKVSAGGAKK